MFLRMAIRARAVQKKMERLKKLREEAVQAHLQGRTLDPSATERPAGLRQRAEAFLMRVIPCHQAVRSFAADLRDEHTLTHFVAKSFVGFLGGVLLTYLLFVVLVGQIGAPLPAATRWCSLAAVVLTLGLAFSSRFRCFVLLVLPQVCSARGRQALLAYALILTLAGPAGNALANARVLADSLRCGQDRMRGATRRVLDLVAQPLRALGRAVKRILTSIKQAVRGIRAKLMAIKRAVMAVYHTVKAAFDWLSGVVSICNKTIGTPFQRCTRSLEQAQSDCKATLGSMFGWMCSPLSVIKVVCYAVKYLDYICDLFDLVKNVVVESVKRKLRDFGRHVKRALYVSVDIEHSFTLATNRSKTAAQVARDIGEDIRSRSEALLGTFGFINSLLGLCILLVPLRAWVYRQRFLTQDHFDNRFVTKQFRQLDWTRARQGRETVLPLTIKELGKYITIWTPRLAASERIRLIRSLGVVFSAAAKMAMFITADYFLYWILAIVNLHGQFKAHIDVPPHLGVRVSGEGAVAQLYRSVIETFEPSEEKWDLDSVPCLPRPRTPDFVRYVQIMSVPLLCVALAALEPYALRARHLVMSHYHPQRARERAVWLYNHVLRARMSLAKLLRRQLRRLLDRGRGREPQLEKVTLLEWVRARFPMCRLLLGPGRQDCCVLCGAVERPQRAERLERCASPGCRGMYCATCYSELGRLCTACRHPLQYGDLSDVSEELGSSDTDAPTPARNDTLELGPKRKKKKKRGRRRRRRKHERDAQPSSRSPSRPRGVDPDPLFDAVLHSSSESSADSSYSMSYQLADAAAVHDPASLAPRWPRFHDAEEQRVWDPATLDQFPSSDSETDELSSEWTRFTSATSAPLYSVPTSTLDFWMEHPSSSSISSGTSLSARDRPSRHHSDHR